MTLENIPPVEDQTSLNDRINKKMKERAKFLDWYDKVDSDKSAPLYSHIKNMAWCGWCAGIGIDP